MQLSVFPFFVSTGERIRLMRSNGKAVNSNLKIKNIYRGVETVSTAEWISVTVEFGGTASDESKIIPMVVGIGIVYNNRAASYRITAKTTTTFTVNCYGLAEFDWVVIELA